MQALKIRPLTEWWQSCYYSTVKPVHSGLKQTAIGETRALIEVHFEHARQKTTLSTTTPAHRGMIFVNSFCVGFCVGEVLQFVTARVELNFCGAQQHDEPVAALLLVAVAHLLLKIAS